MTQPKIKPLALRSHEVAALLEHGKATVVRAVKLSDENTRGCGPGLALLAGNHATWLRDGIGLTWVPFAGSPEVPMPPNKVAEYGPFGAAGEVRWVREAWQAWEDPKTLIDGVLFQADGAFQAIENTREAAEAWADAAHRKPAKADYKPIRAAGCGHLSVAVCKKHVGWRSAATMPRWASRLDIKFVAIACTPNAAGVWEWHGEARRVKK